MSEISRIALFGKLNPFAYKVLESATVFCKLRGNPYVELPHYVHQALQQQDCDIKRIVQHYQLDHARLAKDLTDALDALPRGSTSISDLSSHVEESVERAWVYGTLMFRESQVRTGHMLIAWLKTPQLKRVLLALSKEFEKLKPDEVSDSFQKLTATSPEATMRAYDGSRLIASHLDSEASDAMPPAPLGRQEALQRFSVDLTEKARRGELDPIAGRDDEIRQCIDILLRRRQNNPILTGEAGVGKTAVVEGLAQRIARGEVPPALRDVSLRTLDVGLLSAGASMKGEFENRLRQVVEEVQSSPKPTILFIDEAHTLIGAGGAQGTGDAANLLKPALARGTLRTIAATTWAEYKKYIEKDPALTRRFQTVQVHEPSESSALSMMRGIASALEAHHRVLLLDEALEAAVKLSHRYIPARQLPDKAVSLLDTACARVAVSQHAVPAEVEDSRARIAALQNELEIIAREAAVGCDVGAREANARALLSQELERIGALDARWQSEKALVDRVLALRSELRDKTQNEHIDAPRESDASLLGPVADARGATAARAQQLQELRGLQAELKGLQGERPLILPSVDAQAVATVVGDWTGIPVGRMLQSELETVLKLPQIAGARVVGQSHALEMIGRRIQTSRAGLENPSKPVGVFLLAGPSGVGKTETALTLAEVLYGGEQNLITINMSEFQEAHTVSTLKGAPPGYVGYGEGGVLTEAVRRKPYSVVLLDEVEKAHPDVHEMFFQVFDKGCMEDGEGRRIDFKNTLILLTSNVGSDLIMRMCSSAAGKPDPDAIAKALRKPLLEVFPAALLGRMVTIPYYPLSEEMLQNIVRLQLKRIAERVAASQGVPLTFDSQVVDLIVSRCTELESGARVIDALLSNTLLPRISQTILARTLEGRPLQRAAVSVQNGELAYSLD